MDRNISAEREILDAFRSAIDNAVNPIGTWRARVDRADGSIEETVLCNIVTKDGLNAIAAQMIGSPTGANSSFQYIAVGTQTAAGSLGSVLSGLGEVTRKIGATITSSKSTAILVSTWAGNADSLTGVALASAGMINHADSGSGTLGSHVNSLDVTLQDSDFLTVTVEVQVGSHDL